MRTLFHLTDNSTIECTRDTEHGTPSAIFYKPSVSDNKYILVTENTTKIINLLDMLENGGLITKPLNYSSNFEWLGASLIEYTERTEARRNGIGTFLSDMSKELVSDIKAAIEHE